MRRGARFAVPSTSRLAFPARFSSYMFTDKIIDMQSNLLLDQIEYIYITY